ncbi:MAG: CBS domain-containing protein [Nitrospirae bacterium]|nr:CBS domain-containing protein [Nitrospirota bacterium]
MADLITTHPSADFDGVAAMVAARHLYPGALLAFSGSAEGAVRRFLAEHVPLTVLNPKQVDMAGIDRVVLCDGHGADRAGHFEELARRGPLHVFDHHPVEPGAPAPEWSLIARVGATTTLLVERLKALTIAPAPWEATLMAVGVYEETGSLTYASTTVRDVEAVAWLLDHGADLAVLRRYLSTELNVEQLALLDALAHQLEVRYLDGFKVGVAIAYAERFVPEVAGVASRLLAMEPMDALVTLIAMDDKLLLVARGSRQEIPLGRVAAAFGGGGHPTAASAMVRDRTPVEAAEEVWAALDAAIVPLRRARDLMTPRPVTIGKDATLTDAEALLTRYGVNTLPVMDGQRLAGIVSREAVQKALFHGMGGMAVTEVMEADAYVVTPDTPLREMQDHMITRNLRFAPVLGDAGLVGCITRTDLLRAMHDDLRPPPSGTPAGEGRQRQVLGLMRQRLPEAVCALLQELGEAAARRKVGLYMAGGIVRDLLLGRDNLDIDLVVEGDAIPFAEHWTRTHGGRVHSHERFGTATLTLAQDDLPPGFKVDLATARTEYYAYPTALPTVEHSSLKKDLYRRDFTINALAVALHPPHFGLLIDYFGGQRDLKDGRIRVLHTLSFTEDPTRALRAVRFATRFGFAIGPQTERLMQGAAKMGLYARLSGKRLLTELRYLLSEDDPAQALRALERHGILAGIEPGFGEVAGLDRVIERAGEAIAWYRLQYVAPPLAVWQVYLLAVAGCLAPECRARFWERLDVPGRLRHEWERWNGLPEQAQQALDRDPSDNRLAVYRTLHGAPPEVLVRLMAATGSDPVRQSVSLYLSQLADMRVALSGDDLEALGIAPGPVYREILERLLWARIEGRVATRDEELARVREWYRP